MRSRRGAVSSRAVAVVLAAVLVLAGCGGSDDDDDAAPDDDTASDTAGPTRFTVMVMGDFTGTIAFTVPEVVPAAEAGLQGVDGVEVVGCDTKGDANAAADCQRKAVADGVSAVVMAFGSGSGDQTHLDAGGIPVVGVSNLTSANSYGLSSAFGLYAAVGVGLAKDGCKKLGILYLDGTDGLVDYVKEGMESEGGREVARAPIAFNAPDPTAAIAKLTNADADCIALSVVPTQVAQAVTAVKQTGKSLKMAGVSAIFTEEVLDSLGDAAEGILIVDAQLNSSDKQPGVDKYRKDLASIDDDAEATQQGLSAYVAARYVAAALADIDGVGTPQAVKAALDALRDVDMDGIVPPLSSVELTKPSFKRLINHFGITYEISDGKPKKASDFYDLGPILENV